MKSSVNLSDYYYRELYPTVMAVENERLEIISRLKHNILLLILASIGIIPLIIKFFGSNGAIFYIALAGFAYMAFRLYIKSYSTFCNHYKDNIIVPLLHHLNKSILFYPDMVINKSLFLESQIFKKYPEKYSGSNYISGTISDVKIELSDVNASYVYTNAKGERRESTLFNGILIVAEFHKNFNTKTIILPDFAEKTLGKVVGNFLQSYNGTFGELIKLDNIEFEKEFVVYGEDQIESRYILSHSLMKRLVQYKKRLNKDISISFVNNHIFIAINSPTAMFKPDIFTSLESFDSASKSISTIQNTLGIIRELKLNEKIWSK